MNQAYDDHMANLYGWICLRPNPQAAVANLEDYALRDLFAWLVAHGCETGIPRLVHDLIYDQAAERFLKNQDGKNQESGEGGEE